MDNRNFQGIRKAFIKASELMDSLDYLATADCGSPNNLTEDIFVIDKIVGELYKIRVFLDTERAERNRK